MMSPKLKSLVYREVVLSKKYYIIFAAVYLLFAVFFLLIYLSYKVGNLGKWSENGTAPSSIYFTAVYSLSAIAGFTNQDNGVIMSDIKSRWKKFSFSLPVSVRDKMNTRFVIKLVCLAVTFSVNLVMVLLLSKISGHGFDKETLLNIIMIFDACLIMGFISEIFLLRASSEKEAGLSMVAGFICLIPMYGLCFLLKSKADKRVDEYKALDPLANNDTLNMLEMTYMKEIFFGWIEKIRALAVPVMIVLLIAGYFMGMKLLQRREK